MMRRFKLSPDLIGLTLCLIFCSIGIVHSQPGYTPTQENLENREWFSNAKFGLFLHWGVYSELSDGEWVMNQQEIPINAYERLPTFFNPTQFNAEEWAQAVKKAGMKYITITSKHHDGFAMFDSDVSDYDIVDRTPYDRDVMKELKAACDRNGIKLFFYYSQLDWHHPDYYPRGRTGGGYTGRPEAGDWDSYINYMNTQLTELLTNYGPIGGIWFDGMWDQWDANWRIDETYSLIHKLQPGALIGSNHHKAPFPGEDFQMFERDLPGENTMGFNQTSSISDLPLEMCETMNGSWGYNIRDRRFKSTHELIQSMVKSAGYGANFLLNSGPMPNGKLQPENVDTLMVIGKWLEKYGDAIYNTRKGPVSAKKWGTSTQNLKTKKVYLHILDFQEEVLLIPEFVANLQSMVFFDDKSKVNFEKTSYGLVLQIPRSKRIPIDTIIEIQLK